MKAGVLGGGQLGRMLALAGIPLGVEFIFFDNDPHACASGLGRHICGTFDDEEQLKTFAAQVDVVTIESENIPVSVLEQLAQYIPVFPNPVALQVAQDRLSEKQLFNELGIPTPEFYPINSGEDLTKLTCELSDTLIVKSRRFGYDGKGQARITNAADAHKIWNNLGEVPLIAEQCINFTREVSIIAVRNAQGEMRFYPLAENLHQHGILLRSRAIVSNTLQQCAENYATRVMQQLNYIGVLAFEFFDHNGTLIANEIAPRVHNSGHWTIEGSVTSQFENHIRAILDWPLGDTSTRLDVIMYNLIGEIPNRADILKIRGAHLHDYGKAPRPGRKLGHITLCNPTPERLQLLEAKLGWTQKPRSNYPSEH
jgi:5-(carboxyamino)imidazole ribonucleotide synthase